MQIIKRAEELSSESVYWTRNTYNRLNWKLALSPSLEITAVWVVTTCSLVQRNKDMSETTVST